MLVKVVVAGPYSGRLLGVTGHGSAAASFFGERVGGSQRQRPLLLLWLIFSSPLLSGGTGTPWQAPNSVLFDDPTGHPVTSASFCLVGIGLGMNDDRGAVIVEERALGPFVK